MHPPPCSACPAPPPHHILTHLHTPWHPIHLIPPGRVDTTPAPTQINSTALHITGTNTPSDLQTSNQQASSPVEPPANAASSTWCPCCHPPGAQHQAHSIKVIHTNGTLPAPRTTHSSAPPGACQHCATRGLPALRQPPHCQCGRAPPPAAPGRHQQHQAAHKPPPHAAPQHTLHITSTPASAPYCQFSPATRLWYALLGGSLASPSACCPAARWSMAA
jgi:hypothetical protein